MYRTPRTHSSVVSRLFLSSLSVNTTPLQRTFRKGLVSRFSNTPQTEIWLGLLSFSSKCESGGNRSKCYNQRRAQLTVVGGPTLSLSYNGVDQQSVVAVQKLLEEHGVRKFLGTGWSLAERLFAFGHFEVDVAEKYYWWLWAGKSNPACRKEGAIGLCSHADEPSCIFNRKDCVTPGFSKEELSHFNIYKGSLWRAFAAGPVLNKEDEDIEFLPFDS